MDVCVPWRAQPGRLAAHDYVVKFWAGHGFTVVEGDSEPGEPFSVAQARNRLVVAASGDVVVLADADTVPGDIGQVHAALELVVADPALVVWPFSVYRRVPTVAFGTDLGGLPVIDEPKHGVRSAGLVVVNRETFSRLGGFDERFVGWGPEDQAFWLAASTLARVGRVPGVVFSLWHEVDGGRRMSAESWARWGRYRRAARDPRLMRRLVDNR